MTAPKLPSPIEPLSEDGQVTAPWYQYFLGADHTWRPRVQGITTGTTSGIIRNKDITTLNTTGAHSYVLERPEVGCKTVIVLTNSATHAGPVLAVASTNVAIGPSGQNALSFPTSTSTYEFVELTGVSTLQYYMVNPTGNVSVVASS